MLVTGFPAGAFAANCYIVAPAPGEECVIIDPGQDAERGIEELLARYRLKPIAVLLTHGHIDHMWSVAPVCGAKGIPAYIHPDDREPARRSRPAGCRSMAGQQLFGGMTFSEPDDVQGARRRRDRSRWRGLRASPSAMPRAIRRARSPSAAATDDLDALFTGDLLFAGSIGRTDLPGGDHATMLQVPGPHADPARRDGRAARPRPADHDRRRAPDQPVPDRTRRQPKGGCNTMAFQAPKGVSEYVPPRSALFEEAREAFATSARRACYGAVETAVFEDTALFVRGVGESSDVVSKEMYSFADRGGREITLRPEFTAGVLRSLLEHNLHRARCP